MTTSRIRIRHVWASSTAAALVLALLPGTAPAGAETGPAAVVALPAAHRTVRPTVTQVSAPVPHLTWRSCGGRLKEFQCATAKVPRDYDHPSGTKIRLALTRLRATDPAHRIGTLFTNPGGPGGSGVDFVQSYAKVAYAPQVRARFDILGFDPRGVYRSTPATCFPNQKTEDAVLRKTLLFPVTAKEEVRYDRQSRSLALSCERTSPRRFAHMSTANVARDMDLLRQAVGDRLLSYAGYSYGTFLGATYAKLFPGRIRALVLDGTLEPRAYVGRGSADDTQPVGVRIGQTYGGSFVFAEFLRRCKAAGTRCSLNQLGDPAPVTRKILDGLKRHSVTLTEDGTTYVITYQFAVEATFSALYSPEIWTDLADFLTSVAAKQQGLTATSSIRAASELLKAKRENYPSLGGSLGSTCADVRSTPPIAYPRVADAQDKAYPDFGRYRAWIDLPCAYLGARDSDAYRGSYRQTTQTRVLVLGTKYDPATPYRNTRPFASLFPHASVLTLDGWGHVTLGRSACVAARVTRYLLTTIAPADGTHCASDLRPFQPQTASRSLPVFLG